MKDYSQINPTTIGLPRHLLDIMAISTSNNSSVSLLESNHAQGDLRAEVRSLRRQLDLCQAELEEKDVLIASLREQLSEEYELDVRRSNLQEQLNSYMRTRMEDRSTGQRKKKKKLKAYRKPKALEFKTEASVNSCAGKEFDLLSSCTVKEIDLLSTSRHSSNNSLCSSTSMSDGEDDFQEPRVVRDVVDEIQRWLFLEGGNLRDVESLITEYCNFMRSIDIPLDRIFIAGMMLHPSISAYVWKWEIGQDFNEHEVPHSAFQKPNYNPDEPFAVLLEGRAMEYRMNAKTIENGQVPPGCAWFQRDGYKDYYALPIYHRGEFKGAMAWCTKSMEGWNEQHIQIFERSLAALSTILRLHTNDLVRELLTSRLEEEVKKQTKELATANENLEMANQKIINQSQDQLRHFAMMSHEIRTPLNCIVGMSNLLMQNENLGPLKEPLEMITSSGDLLVAVVDDVLDYSKLAAGKMETRVEGFRLRPAIDTVVATIRSKAEQSEVQLCSHFGDDLPSRLRTDARRLSQILYNLLGNAVKYGRHGKLVEFRVETARQEDQARVEEKTEEKTSAEPRDMIRFTVKDYGNGIAPSEQKKIFEPFLQASTNSPSDGGTGLGLAITSRLVKALGGTISVKSDFGHWCEFQVDLPLDEEEETEGVASNANVQKTHEESKTDEPSALPTGPSMQRRNSLKKGRAISDLKILVAEDNLINQKVLVRTLKMNGVKSVDVVENGQLAVEAAEKSHYDLIFMDLQMPVMDGLEATRILTQKRTEGKGPYPKIVFLTAHALQEFHEKAAASGGDGFISKPFKPKVIKELLSDLDNI